MRTEPKLFTSLQATVERIVQSINLAKVIPRLGRPRALSLTETLTAAIFQHTAQVTTKKKLWQLLEPTCSYKTFVVSVNRLAALALRVLLLILRGNRAKAHRVKHVDSTDIPVSTLRKASRHRTMAGLAEWGKTGKGWFYGLKLHLIADLKGRLLSLKFTPGNQDDRSVVMDLAGELDGIFIGDAGYVSDYLAYLFHREGERWFLAKPRANMRVLASEIQTWLYSTRMRVELQFRNLKMFYGLITSLPRSVTGYLANYVYAILAYVLA